MTDLGPASFTTREAIRGVLARHCRGADRLDCALVRICFHSDARDNALNDGDLTIGVRFVDRFESRDGGSWRSARPTVVHERARLEPVRATARSTSTHHGRRDPGDIIFPRLRALDAAA